MLVDRFLGIVDALEETWRRIPARTADPTSAHDAPRYANRSLHADVPFALGIRELMRADPVGSMSQVRKRIRVVVDYCAKLGQRRDVNDEVDLFTVLPPAYLGRTCVHVESSVVVSVAPGPATRKAHETPIITLPKWRYSRRLLISGKISRSGHI